VEVPLRVSHMEHLNAPGSFLKVQTEQSQKAWPDSSIPETLAPPPPPPDDELLPPSWLFLAERFRPFGDFLLSIRQDDVFNSPVTKSSESSKFPVNLLLQELQQFSVQLNRIKTLSWG